MPQEHYLNLAILANLSSQWPKRKLNNLILRKLFPCFYQLINKQALNIITLVMDFTIYLLSHNKKCCFSNLGNMCMFYFHFYGLHASDYTYSTLVEYILYVVKLLKFTNQLSVLQNKSKISFFFLAYRYSFCLLKSKKTSTQLKILKIRFCNFMRDTNSRHTDRQFTGSIFARKGNFKRIPK